MRTPATIPERPPARAAGRRPRPAASALAGLLPILAAAGCGGPPPVSPSEVQAIWRDAVPAGPEDAAWRAAPVYSADLIPQDMVEPRLLEPSTPEVRVQAITDGRRLALLLSWDDATKDDLPGTGRFSDACAIQLPRGTDPDVPAPQMGETGRPVEITYWRATWQGWADGRADSIRSIHPGAVVDHYPFEAEPLAEGSPEKKAMTERYAPAEALGARMEGPRESPGEQLVAEGPGTLDRMVDGKSESHGRRTPTGWEVVLVRELPGGLGSGARSQIAFAVWDGARQEVGARKMRSAWVPLAVEERE